MIHPEEGSNPTFENEVDRLIAVGIPEHLIEMVGDGNCLFYYMLHYLWYRPRTVSDMTSMMAGLPLKHDYPLVGIRKHIREAGDKLSEAYWTTLASWNKEERLDFIYNPNSYFMDDTYTGHPDNIEYQGRPIRCYHFCNGVQDTSCSVLSNQLNLHHVG